MSIKFKPETAPLRTSLVSASTDSEGLVKPKRSNELKWSWLRKIKVGLLTFILLVCLTILLLVPDQQSQQSLITVGRGQSLSQVVDDTIDEFSSTPEVLSLTIGGSLVPPDVTRLAPSLQYPTFALKLHLVSMLPGSQFFGYGSRSLSRGLMETTRRKGHLKFNS